MLKAQVGAEGVDREVEGQVAVMETRRGRIRRVDLVPSDVPADPVAVEAIGAADQVVLAPGSLYTSLLPVLMVPEIRTAVDTTQAQVVQVGNLAAADPRDRGARRRRPPAARCWSTAPASTCSCTAEDGRLDVDEAAVEALGVRARPDADVGPRDTGPRSGAAGGGARRSPLMQPSTARSTVDPRNASSRSERSTGCRKVWVE